MAITTKICGITNVDDALAAVDAGSHLIGLNFYRKSKRFVSIESAAAIADAVGDKVQLAGVFVNATSASIADSAWKANLSFIQLHGDESPALWQEVSENLKTVKLIRAIRVFDSNWTAALEQAKAWKDAGAEILLFDAGSDVDYGGTGNPLDWKEVTDLDIPRPWWLAGGLTAENVATAIRVAMPDGVDVASGVESAPGEKDHALVRSFVRSAMMA